jgi:hypothetical protein
VGIYTLRPYSRFNEKFVTIANDQELLTRFRALFFELQINPFSNSVIFRDQFIRVAKTDKSYPRITLFYQAWPDKDVVDMLDFIVDYE